MGASTSGSASAAGLAQQRPRRGGWLSWPIISDAGALVRFFQDPKASTAGKLFILLAVAYIVCPVDAIPDLAPVLGWLDDIGVAAVVFAYIGRVLGKYKKQDAIDTTGEAVPAG